MLLRAASNSARQKRRRQSVEPRDSEGLVLEILLEKAENTQLASCRLHSKLKALRLGIFTSDLTLL